MEDLEKKIEKLEQENKVLKEKNKFLGDENKFLGEENKVLKEVSNNSPGLIFVTDKNGIIYNFYGDQKLLYKNPEKFLNKPLEEVLKNEKGKIEKEAIEKINEAIKEAKLKGKSRQEYPLTFDEMIKYFSVSTNYKNGQFYHTVIDITEKKNKEKQKEEFISSIAHDLRSPFTGLIGLNDLIIEKIIDKEKLDGEDLEEVKEEQLLLKDSINTLFRVVNSFHDYINSTRYHEPTLISLSPVVNDIYFLQLPNLKRKKINFENEVDKNYQIYTNPHSLNTILKNLVSNSIKYTKAGGKISISANDLNEYNQIIVKDTGVGMDEKTIKSLYNIGFTTKDLDGDIGTGFGLVSVKNYVSNQNGEIKVESELNKGTTFYITLPKIDSS